MGPLASHNTKPPKDGWELELSIALWLWAAISVLWLLLTSPLRSMIQTAA